MEKHAHPGDFCPNPTCADYRKVQSDQAQPNIKRLANPCEVSSVTNARPGIGLSRTPVQVNNLFPED